MLIESLVSDPLSRKCIRILAVKELRIEREALAAWVNGRSHLEVRRVLIVVLSLWVACWDLFLGLDRTLATQSAGH